ncbi:FGGY-family carbohydrate kinase [Olsenella sp. HMSC062G07]|uniref:FGGY-family carbohydrate kinase n=1 Tax=Olsenella sp. HMSC062G07 TaxID=1739330 RepID=UPI0008A1C979|nr:FGGY-family carbohydrate kinase [Olsenella sp. HMSC062G07]OFK24975.1 carbohydrate kinase [Olsenella sp. HMSC062G07]
MSYYIGLDNGGTATKAALFDETGAQLAVCSVATSSQTPRPDFVERDMEEVWRANCAVLRGVLKDAGIPAQAVASVGVCGHGKGLYLWGKDGAPVRPAISSTDNRAHEYVRAWRADGTERRAFALSCQHVMSCQPVALLAWLKDHEPQAYANIAYVFECKDYLRFRLTGEARAELTDYSGSGLMNLHTKKFDPELLALFGIEEVSGALPPLCSSVEIAGVVSEEAAAQTGLVAGTPVIGGFFDIDACALASGVVTGDLVCMIAGTWSINEYIRDAPVLDGSVAMNSLYCLPGTYLIEESSATSAGNNEWFIRRLLPEVAQEAKNAGKSVYEVVNDWVAEVGPHCFVPTFLPFLMGSNAHQNARGTFVGLDVSHDRRHLARSVYEGITFCHRQHLDRLLASRKDAPRAIRLSGGAARSEVWSQLFADVMQLPVQTVLADEAGALGCAIAGAVATGRYASMEEAVERMVGVGRTFSPNEALRDTYERKYAVYRKAVACLDGLWDDMEALADEADHASQAGGAMA